MSSAVTNLNNSLSNSLVIVGCGEQFLLTAVMLEHLYALYEASEQASEENESDETEETEDLGESGGEWMSEHGFDSH